MDTVIVGSGIIGVSTAYYLSHTTPASKIHLIEASPRLFSSASGFAAGFCTADWYSGSVAPLGALSFRLHRELAAEHDGRRTWGYSRSTGTSMVPGRGAGAKTRTGRGEDRLRQNEGESRDKLAGTHDFHSGAGPAWLTRREGDRIEVISEDDTTAQVDPLRLCKFLLGEAMERGVRLHQPAKVVGVSVDNDSVMNGVRIKGEDGEYDIDCKRLVITAGAWTADVFATLFPASKLGLPISQYAGHSLVVRSPRWTAEHEAEGCHAIFSTDSSGYSPEVFSRIGGEIYIAGLNDPDLDLPEPETLPALSDDISVEKLRQTAKRMLGLPSGDDDLEVVKEGLCFRPVSKKGTPIIARISDQQLGGGMKTLGGKDGGVFVSAGHGPWGISQSLGTGKVLAELIEDKPTSANIRGLGV